MLEIPLILQACAGLSAEKTHWKWHKALYAHTFFNNTLPAFNLLKSAIARWHGRLILDIGT